MKPYELQTLLSVSKAIATVRDKQDLLRIIIKQIQPIFTFYDCGLFVFNRDNTTLEDWTVSMPAVSPSEANTLLAEQNVATFSYPGSVWEGLLAQLRQAGDIVIHDYSEPVPGWADYVQASVLEEVGYQESLMGLLQLRGEEIGVFAINSPDFSPSPRSRT